MLRRLLDYIMCIILCDAIRHCNVYVDVGFTPPIEVCAALFPQTYNVCVSGRLTLVLKYSSPPSGEEILMTKEGIKNLMTSSHSASRTTARSRISATLRRITPRPPSVRLPLPRTFVHVCSVVFYNICIVSSVLHTIRIGETGRGVYKRVFQQNPAM